MRIKFMAALCAAAMLAAMLAGCGAAEKTESVPTQAAAVQQQVSADTFTVHASVPGDWTDIGIWAWSDTEGDLFEAWPGEAMTPDGNGWYTYALPEWVGYVIINGNDGFVQTADLPVEAEEVWITVQEDGACRISYTEVTEVPSYTVYARVPSGWENVCIWAWSDTQGDLFESWPGGTMAQAGGGWYARELPQTYDSVVINGNDGSVQTADIYTGGEETWITVNADLSYSLSNTEPEETTVYSPYAEVFSSRNLSDRSRVSDSMSTIAGVLILDNGDLLKEEYAYQEDVVREAAYTYYYFLNSYSADQVAALETGLQQNLARFEQLDFASVDYSRNSEYIECTILFHDMHVGENLDALQEMGILANADYISAMLTLSDMYSRGYILME